MLGSELCTLESCRAVEALESSACSTGAPEYMRTRDVAKGRRGVICCESFTAVSGIAPHRRPRGSIANGISRAAAWWQRRRGCRCGACLMVLLPSTQPGW